MTITKLLGIKYPIFQGAMAQIARHELVSAVSNAGGVRYFSFRRSKSRRTS